MGGVYNLYDGREALISISFQRQGKDQEIEGGERERGCGEGLK